jgi:hypothetical protein
MSQQNSGRSVKAHQQMIQALELRAAGASYLQIGKALSVSKSRAWRIVGTALGDLVHRCAETAERVKQLELHRLDRYRLALDARRSDPRVVDSLIRISERTAKLHGLDAPQRVEASGPDGGPIETQEQPPDFSKFTLDELYFFDALDKKAHGVANWDETLRQQEEFRRKCYPSVKQPESWTEGLKKVGILTTAGETAPAGS